MSRINRTSRIAGALALLGFLLTALPTLAAEARRVNINSADASQLALLPRVGPSVAQKIIAFRKENGPFKSAEDLMLVQGIGEKTFQLIKPHVAISGETTLKEKVKASKPAEGGADKPEKKKPSDASPSAPEPSR